MCVERYIICVLKKGIYACKLKIGVHACWRREYMCVEEGNICTYVC